MFGFSWLDEDPENSLLTSGACLALFIAGQWGEFLPSPAQAVAIADRLIDNATILRFSGKPYRQPKEILGAPLDEE